MARTGEIELDERADIAADLASDMVLGTYIYPEGAYRGSPDAEGHYPINQAELARALQYSQRASAVDLMDRPRFKRQFSLQLYRKQRNILCQMADLKPMIEDLARTVLADIALTIKDAPESLEMKDKIQIAKLALGLKAKFATADDPKDAKQTKMSDLLASALDKIPDGDTVAAAMRAAQERQMREAGLLMDGEAIADGDA